MSCNSILLTIGVFIGLMLGITLMNWPSIDYSKYNKIKEECEKSLPRDQHCKLVGVPIESKN